MRQNTLPCFSKRNFLEKAIHVCVWLLTAFLVFRFVAKISCKEFKCPHNLKYAGTLSIFLATVTTLAVCLSQDWSMRDRKSHGDNLRVLHSVLLASL